MKPSQFRETAIRFSRYTGLNLSDFIDWYLSVNLKVLVFKMDEYLTFCQEHGMYDDESVKEFNLRYWKNGDKVNDIIWDIIK